jgi:hypothetical protein
VKHAPAETHHVEPKVAEQVIVEKKVQNEQVVEKKPEPVPEKPKE